MSKETEEVIKKKKKACNKYKHSPTDENHLLYQEARNKATSNCREAKAQLEKLIASEMKKDSKSFWKYIRSKTKVNTGLGDLTNDEGVTITVNREKANLLNKFFASVFNKEDLNHIPKADKMSEQSMPDIEINETMVAKKLEGINTSKSPGADSIHPKVIYETRFEIALPLNIIFRKSLDEGKLPAQWKNANITAIHKKGSRKIAGNYRLVSLTSIIGKCKEKIIRDKVVKHLEENN